jgi:hypothetical protein
MTELEKIAYAKSFIDKLANGINPIDDSTIPIEDVVNNVRLSRCFFYVSDILRQVIDNGGITPVAVVKEKTPKKQPYSLSHEQAEQFKYSTTPIPATEIFKRIIAIGPSEGVKKFPKRNLTKWLLSLGLIEEITMPLGTKMKRPTSAGEGIGILLEERQGQYGNYYVMLYNLDAQHFIIDNIDAVLAFDKADDNIDFQNQGRPWSNEHEKMLIDMFNNGSSITEIATVLKRKNGGIRARLKRLGLIKYERYT